MPAAAGIMSGGSGAFIEGPPQQVGRQSGRTNGSGDEADDGNEKDQATQSSTHDSPPSKKIEATRLRPHTGAPIDSRSAMTSNC
jgi:hypothetical protein